MNPPDALVCGECGTADLAEAAYYISFGCLARLVSLGMLMGLLSWGGSYALHRAEYGFTATTGFKSPAVWLIEKCAHVLIILFVFYFLSMCMPDAAGEQFRRLISKLCMEFLHFVFHIGGGFLIRIGKVLLRLLGAETAKGEKTKH